jgi:Zn2+/Cd2+-exporting ATPase
VIALAATGALSAVWVAVLHNLGTFIVIANAGRLLRMDDDVDAPEFAPGKPTHVAVARAEGPAG